MTKSGTALTAGLAILLLLLAAPFATGMLTQNAVELRVAAIDENPALHAEITDYERGWFSSRAVIEIGPSENYQAGLADIGDFLPTAGLLATGVPIVIEIAHGPISSQGGLHLGMAQVRARPDNSNPVVQSIESDLGLPYLFEFRGRAGFGRHFEFDGDIPPIDSAGAIGEIAFSGLSFDGTAIGNRLEARADSQSLAYQSPFLSAGFDSLHLDTRYDFRGREQIPDSRSAFSVGRVVATSPLLGSAPLFETRDMRFSGSLLHSDAGSAAGTSTGTRSGSGDKLSLSLDYSVAVLNAGESLVLTDAALGARLESIDAAAATDYYALLRSEYQNPDHMLAALLPISERVIAGGPSLTLDPLHFTTGDGRLSGKLRVSLDEPDPSVASAELRNIAVLYGLARVSAELEVAKPLAQRLMTLAIQSRMGLTSDSGPPMTAEEQTAMAEAQAGLMLISLSAQGMLTDLGDRFTTEIEFADGELSVNGAPPALGGL